jgi:hypothetical protein
MFDTLKEVQILAEREMTPQRRTPKKRKKSEDEMTPPI